MKVLLLLLMSGSPKTLLVSDSNAKCGDSTLIPSVACLTIIVRKNV